MQRRGINYDVGTFFSRASSSRPVFDPEIVRREIAIIRNDLHCNAIRVSGQEIDRLVFAAEAALEQGMEVWFSPARIDADEAELLAYLDDCARAAGTLFARSPHVVFVVGCELTLFMNGIIDGADIRERIRNIQNPLTWIKSGMRGRDFGTLLNHTLDRACVTVRNHFPGALTYASGIWEKVDWSRFDIVSIDHYRDSRNRQTFGRELQPYFAHGKPVVATEFGCCTYRGAADRGGLAWAIVDWEKTPPELNGDYVRDEEEQARTIAELLDVFVAEGMNGAFVFTFVNPGNAHDPAPRRDLDMASYSMVKTLRNAAGTTYPDLSWEPKVAFHTLADYYARIA